MQIKDLIRNSGFNGKSAIKEKEVDSKFYLDRKDSEVFPKFINYQGLFLAVYKNQLVGIISHEIDNVFNFWGNSEVITEENLSFVIGIGRKYFSRFLIENGVESSPFIKNSGNNPEYIAPKNDIVEAIIYYCGKESHFDTKQIPNNN